MTANTKLTRGERNNNPGNIRETPDGGIRWAGERSSDDDQAFEEFATPFDGLRALGRVLLVYQRKHGLRTIREIISRWAPSNENNTESYILAVAKAMNVPPTQPLDLEDATILAELARAIVQHENGRCIYPKSQIMAAMQDALA